MIEKNKFKHFKHFIIRTPLFHLNFLKQLLSEPITTTPQLKEICQQKEIQEAIFLASPNLYAKIIKWLNGELNDKKETENLPQSLYKYLARMSSRCTPFGLFAGNSVGLVNDITNLTIPSRDQNRRVTRLDMNYLCSVVQDLNKNHDIREITLFYPNNSLYQIGDKLRYVEYNYQNTKRIHHITAVDKSEYLQKILNSAKKGCTIQQLAELIIDDEISIEDAREFIHELIDSQLLLPEFEPSVTGKGVLEDVLIFLERKCSSDNFHHVLKETCQELLYIDKQAPGVDTEKYYQIAENLKELGTNYELKFLFQTDMVKPVNDLSISHEIVEQMKEGIEVLDKLSLKPSETNLTKFREAFYKKYEDAEIPLLQALDTESGIGYLQNFSAGAGDYSPLIDNIILQQKNNQSTHIEWNNIYTFLFNKYLHAIKENLYEVQITNQELNEIYNNANLNELPATISSMVQLVKIGDQVKIIMSSAGGSSAANLLGRFCHTDNKIQEHVGKIIQKEEEYYADKIIAEIVHLPESRTGNILHRPTLRKYEIPYLAKSSVTRDYQVLPEDILISVKNNRIILRSKRLNKEIIPRLTTAHNFSYNALPVYQFLCDMQIQDLKGGVGFNWGPLSNQYAFLPRVCYKNLILSLAGWNIQKKDFENITKIKDDGQLLEQISNWRENLRMPEWVVLEDGDNELLIKLNNLLSVKTLIAMVKNRPSFKLTEFFADEENLVVKGTDGAYTNEFIFSFYKETETKDNE